MDKEAAIRQDERRRAYQVCIEILMTMTREYAATHPFGLQAVNLAETIARQIEAQSE